MGEGRRGGQPVRERAEGEGEERIDGGDAEVDGRRLGRRVEEHLDRVLVRPERDLSEAGVPPRGAEQFVEGGDERVGRL